ncbi:hypothetical protein L218DRAFT_436540 [Marasmius fiardii PR-910]|nr:hypothetical protein L218DRAFT_436540 [Marasmius fiardii PR-910]
MLCIGLTLLSQFFILPSSLSHASLAWFLEKCRWPTDDGVMFGGRYFDFPGKNYAILTTPATRSVRVLESRLSFANRLAKQRKFHSSANSGQSPVSRKDAMTN